jgi:hypothetical protein
MLQAEPLRIRDFRVGSRLDGVSGPGGLEGAGTPVGTFPGAVSSVFKQVSRSRRGGGVERWRQVRAKVYARVSSPASGITTET